MNDDQVGFLAAAGVLVIGVKMLIAWLSGEFAEGGKR